MSETCYGHSSPNAVLLPNYGPCNPQAGSISLCCETGQTCLTNGLCVTQSGVYYNGGCTDSTYKAANCPTFCTSGDANWVVECHDSAVKDGDFCCSVNGTTTGCCDTASNGLGLVAAVSSAQAVSATSFGASTVPTSVLGNIVPTSISSGSTTSSPESIASNVSQICAQIRLASLQLADSLTSTSLPTATSKSHGSKDMPRKEKADIGVGVGVGVLALLCGIVAIACIRRWIKRRDTIVALNNRREGTDKSGPQAQPPTEGVTTEVQGSPVGPVEMDANQTHVTPADPPPYGTATPDVAPDNNPLREPSATPGSWYSPNLANL